MVSSRLQPFSQDHRRGCVLIFRGLHCSSQWLCGALCQRRRLLEEGVLPQFPGTVSVRRGPPDDCTGNTE